MLNLPKKLFCVDKQTHTAKQLPGRLPHYFMLELTAQCNFNCPYCYCLWHEFPLLSNKPLSTGEWQNIIAFLSKKKVDSLLFTGGEVLLRKDIKEIVSFARAQLPQGNLSLFTNSSLLTEDLFHFFKSMEIKLFTSLQGLESYSDMTGSHCSAEYLLANVRYARNNDWPMAVSITVTRQNKYEICNMFAAAAEAGACTIQVGAMMPQGRGKQHLELTLSRNEWECIKNQIRNMPNCGVPYTFCDEMICECRKHSKEIFNRFHNPDKTICRAGKDYGVISPNGIYRKCLHFYEE